MKASTYVALFMASAAISCSINAQGPPGDSGNPGQPGSAATGAQINIPPGAAGMGASAYGQNPLRISPGVTVNWTNTDSMPHTVTADDGSFDSGTLTGGQSFSHTFNTAGTFTYFCQIHGKASMNGSIVVGGDGSEPSPGY